MQIVQDKHGTHSQPQQLNTQITDTEIERGPLESISEVNPVEMPAFYEQVFQQKVDHSLNQDKKDNLDSTDQTTL